MNIINKMKTAINITYKNLTHFSDGHHEMWNPDFPMNYLCNAKIIVLQ